MTQSPFILLDDQLSGQARFYENPVDVITVRDPKQLTAAFDRIQAHLDDGKYVAGFVSYEAGLWLETKLNSLFDRGSDNLLLQMGVFEGFEPRYPEAPCETIPRLDLKPAWAEADYLTRFEKVIDYIKSGDVYQINLTFPMHSPYIGSAFCLYDTLRARQPVHYGGVIALGDMEIVTFSPELFFQQTGEQISMRPMKGTIKRLPDREADLAQREAMRADIKSQAENLMIVDLLRNDLSRLAQKGSVNVPELFSLETYPTLHQMTSKVTARLRPDVDVAQLFKSLFPCGSVTGAPKIRAMEIIQELEDTPRGPYCGAIGYLDPDRKACFNVGIRTAIIENGALKYHVGSGVVLDSDGASEYEECLLKAKVLSDIPSLVETFLWDPERGIFNRKRHFARLASSASALGYAFDEIQMQSALQKIQADSQQKCRLVLSENGSLSVEHEDYKPFPLPIKLALSKHALSLGVQEYRHKVLARDFYDGERSRVSALTGALEVIFLNPEDEICEGSFSSLFAEIDGQLVTPPLSSGLLPGVLRSKLLQTGEAISQKLTKKDLECADKIYIGNSLRGMLPAEFIDFDLH